MRNDDWDDRGWQPGRPELLVKQASATFMVPQMLLDEYAGMSDLFGRALRGEIEFKPPPEPPWHRCVFCWLLSLLPGHERCEHGRLSCDDCHDDYC